MFKYCTNSEYSKANNELMKGRFVVILHKLASGDTLHVENTQCAMCKTDTVSYKERTKFSIH